MKRRLLIALMSLLTLQLTAQVGAAQQSDLTTSSDGTLIDIAVRNDKKGGEGNHSPKAMPSFYGETIAYDKSEFNVDITYSSDYTLDDNEYLTVTITLSEDVTDFEASDITLLYASLISFSGSGSVYELVVKPWNINFNWAAIDGDMAIRIDAGQMTGSTSGLSNNGAGITIYTLLLTNRYGESQTPLITRGQDIASKDPVTIYLAWRIKKSGLETTNLGLTKDDFIVTNGYISGFDEGWVENGYDLIITPTNAGEVRVSIESDHLSSTRYPLILGSSFYWNSTSPGVEITADPATTGTFTANLEFTESVTGLEIGDFTVTNGSLSNLTGSGTSYTVDVTPTSEGAVTLTLDAETVLDNSSNGNFASNELSVIYDLDALMPSTDAPAVVNGTFTTNITFPEIVTGFDITDLNLINATADNFTGSGANYSVDIIPTGTDDITIDFPAAAAQDGSGNDSYPFSQTVSLDLTSPEVTISSSSVVRMRFTTTLNFDEEVTGLELSDLVVTNGTVSNLSGSGSRYTFRILPTAEGDITINIPAGAVQDLVGNDNVAAPERIVVADFTAPTASLNADAFVNGLFTVGITWDESVNGFNVDKLELTNATASNFSGSGTDYTVDLMPQAEGDVTIKLITPSAASDKAGNASTETPVLTVFADLTAPGVTMSAPTLVNGVFTTHITFDEAVTGFEVTDLVLTNATASNFAGSGANYTVDLTPAATGSITIDIPAAAAQDPAGNDNTAATQLSLSANLDAPGVVITADALVNAPFTATITFSKAVTGFELGDLSISNATASNFTGSGTDYTVDLTPVTDGDVTIDIPVGVAEDDANRVNIAADQVIVVADYTAPGVTIGASPKVNGTFTATITFDEEVTGFEVTDLILSNVTAANFAGSGANYTVDLTPITNGGITIDIPATIAQDLAGNENTAASQVTVETDLIAPEVVISAASLVNGVFTTNLTFTEEIVGLEIADLTLTNATASNLSGAGANYTVDITPVTDGDITINLAAGVVQDPAGNDNVAADEVTVSADLTAPGVNISAGGSFVNTTFTTTITFDESVTGFEVADLTIVNATAANFSGSGTTYTVDLTPIADGSITVDIAANVATDAAGNDNTAASQLTVEADITPPTFTMTPVSGASYWAQISYDLKVQFSEEVTGLAQDDFTVSNATIDGFTATDADTYTLSLTPDDNGAVTVDLAANAVQDQAGLPNASGDFSIMADFAQPTATITGPAHKVSGTFQIEVVFSEIVTGFSVDGINCTRCIASNLAGSGTDYTVDITPNAGESSVRVRTNSGAAQDVVGRNSAQSSRPTYQTDYVSPNTTISVVDLLVNGTFTATITFNEDVENFAVEDISLTNATATNFSGSEKTYTADISPVASGNVTIDVAAGVANDLPGNGNNAATQVVVVADLLAPTVTISAADLVNGLFTANIDFSETVTGFDVTDIVVSNGNTSNFSGSGANYIVDITPVTDGNVTLDIAAATSQDVAGNDNVAATTKTVVADLMQPAVTINGAASVVNGVFTANITFDEAVTGFEVSDIALVNATAANFTGSGAAYTVDLTPVTDGAVTVDIAAGVANDAAGNGNTVASQLTVTADLTVPTVTLSTSAAEPSNADSYTVDIAFSETVTGLESSDFTVSNGSVSGLTGFDDTYSLTLTPAADGVVTLTLPAASTEDNAANDNVVSNTISITSDRTVPTVSASAPTLANAAFTVDFTFSEAVTGFEQSDIVVSNGTITAFTGSDAAYSATINPTATGNVTVDLSADIAQDAAGNGNTAAATTTISADLTAPGVTINTVASDVNGVFTANITFDEPVTGFELSDITISNGTESNFVGSGTSYTIDITPVTDGTVTVDIAADVATDAAANGNTAAGQLSVTADFTAPVITITESPVVSNTITYTLNFSEEVAGFEVADLTVTNGALSNFTGSGNTYSVDVTGDGNGLMTFTVSAGVAQDLAGNGNEAAYAENLLGFNLAPVFTSAPTTSTDNGSFYTYAIDVEDLNGDEVSISAPVLPGWLSLDQVYTVSTLSYSSFSNIRGIAIDSHDNIFISANGSNKVFKIDAAGNFTTFAGSDRGFTDGTGTSAQFNGPDRLTIDKDDNLYLADQFSKAIRKITPSGEVSTLAGGSISGDVDGTGTEARFSGLGDMAVDPTTGNIYVINSAGNSSATLRQVTPAGVVTTLSSSAYGNGITVDSKGNLYYMNSSNELIKRDIAGNETLLAGSGHRGSLSQQLIDGTGTNAKFGYTYYMAIDKNDNLLISDNGLLRRVSPGGEVRTLAGQVDNTGLQDGVGSEATFKSRFDMATASNGDIFAVDYFNNRIRQLTGAPAIIGFANVTSGNYNVSLEATDGINAATSQDFTITVNNIDAAVESLSLSQQKELEFAYVNNGNVVFEGNAVQYTLNYNKAVYVSGDPYIELNIAGENLTYKSGSGTRSLVFEWVATDEFNNGDPITYSGTDALKLNGGSMTDVEGADVSTTLPDSFDSFYNIGLWTVKSITTDAADGVYGIGDEIRVLLEFESNFDGINYDPSRDDAAIITNIQNDNNVNPTEYYVDYDLVPPGPNQGYIIIEVAEGDYSPDFDFEMYGEGDTFGYGNGAAYLWNGNFSADYYFEFDWTFDFTNPAIDHSIAAVKDIVIDGIRPTVDMAFDKTFGTSFTATLTFSEVVSGLELGDLLVSNGTASNLTGSGAIYTVDILPTAAGALTLDLAADQVSDIAGNGNEVATQIITTAISDADDFTTTLTATYDAPTTGYISDSNGGTATITFDEAVTGFEQSDIIATNLSITSFTAVSASQYQVGFEAVAEGGASLQVPAHVATNGSAGNGAAIEITMTADFTVPTVTTSAPALISAGFTVDITFSEAVTGFELSDLTVSNGTVTALTGADASYTATINPTASGDVTVDLPDAVVQDAAGNDNTAAATTTVTADLIAPGVTITSSESDVNGIFTTNIVFDESVTGFEEADISVSNATKSNFTGSGSTYTIDITPVAEGAVTVDVSANKATDAAGNGNSAASQLSVTADFTSPVISLTESAVVSNAITYTLTFSEGVVDFDVTDLVVANGTLSNFTGSGDTYSVDVTGDGNGLMTFTVPVDVAQDVAGNGNEAAYTENTLGFNVAPIFDSTPVTSTDNNASSPYSYTPEATDPNGDEVTFSASTLPGWLSFEDRYWVGTMAADSYAIDGAAGVAVDSEGSLYVANTDKHVILKYDQDGNQSIYAGIFGNAGFNNSSIPTDARFRSPREMVFDKDDNLYVVDQFYKAIRKITPAGEVTTLAGSNSSGFKDGVGTDARFSGISDITIDKTTGSLYTISRHNQAIRKITSDGTVTKVATGIFQPNGIAIDSKGNLFVNNYYYISKITPEGDQSVFAGDENNGFTSSKDGIGTDATFYTLEGMGIDADDNLYVSDNYSIRKITPAAVVTTVAGSTQGTADGLAEDATFGLTNDIAIDANGTLYVADEQKSSVRKIYYRSMLLGSPAATGDFNVVIEATDGVTTPTQQAFTISVSNVVAQLESIELQAPELPRGVYSYDGTVVVEGVSVQYALNYNKVVFVTGEPYIELNAAGEKLTYKSGSGTGTLIFEWVATDNLNNNEPITYNGTDALNLNGGSMKDGDGVDVPLTLDASFESFYNAAVFKVKSITVDDPDGTYGIGDEIKVLVELESLNTSYLFDINNDEGSIITNIQNDSRSYQPEYYNDYRLNPGPNKVYFIIEVEEGDYTSDFDFDLFEYGDDFDYYDGAVYIYYYYSQDEYDIEFDRAVAFTDPDINHSIAATRDIVIDGIRPTVDMAFDKTFGTSFTATLTFSEVVTGLELGDLVVSNGTASNLSGSGAVYTVDILATGAGIVTLDLAADLVVDVAGNGNEVATQIMTTGIADADDFATTLSASYDSPTAGYISAGNGGTATITFDEAVTGFDQSDIIATNLNITSFTAISTSQYQVSFEAVAEGAASLQVPAHVATNGTAGNSAAIEVAMIADLTAPTVTASAASLVNGSFTVDFAFSEAVTGFDMSDLTVSNGTVTGFTGSDAAYTATINPTADGNVTIDIAADVAQDAVGNANTAAATTTVSADLTQPGVSISTAASLVNGVFSADITFDESVTGFELSDLVIVNATTANFSGSGTAYSVDLTPVADGAVTVDLAAGIAQDAAGNGNSAATQLSLVADLTNPIVTLSSTTSGTSNADSYEVTISFSEAVTGLEASDFTASNGTVTDLAGSGESYTLTLTPSADGAVSLSLAAANTTDAAGNSNEASNELSITSDRTAPTVTTTAASLVNGTFTATITFDEEVTGFDISDLVVGNGTLGNFSGSGANYTIDIAPITSGNVTLDIAAAVAEDLAENANTLASQLTVVADLVAPGVNITAASLVNGTFTATITFDEAVTGFEQSDIVVVNGSLSNFAGSDANYTVDVTPTTDGTITLDIAAAIAQDAAGNDNTVASQLSLEADLTNPTITLSTAAGTPSNADSYAVTISFSEAVTGLEVSDFTVSNGAVSDLSGSGGSYTLTLSPSVDGVVSLSLAAATTADDAGNNNEVSNTISIDSDRTVPTITASAASLVNGAFTVDFTFSEAVTGFDLSDLTVSNGVVTGFTGTDAAYTATINPTTDGTVTVNMAADVAQDVAGNGNTAMSQVSVLADLTSPSVSLTTSAAAIVKGGFTVDIIFDETVADFDLSDISIVNAAASNFSGSGTAYSVDLTPTTDGEITVDVAAGVANDAAGNGNTAASQLSVIADLTAPTVTLSTSAADPSNADSYVITIAFSEAVTGLETSDFTVNNGALSSLAGTGNSYFMILSPSADGEVSLTLNADATTDIVGNGNEVSNTISISSDRTEPAVTLSAASAIVNTGFTVDITFDESVTGFELSDINIVNATAANFTGSGAAYSVDLTPVTDGAITLDIAAGVAIDAANNTNTVASQLSIEADLTNPTVTLSSSASGPSNADSYAVTVAFSESVSGLNTSDFTVSNGVVSDLTGSGDSYTLTLSPSADGAVTLSLAAATTADDAGNSTEASNELSITSDRTIPTVTASAASLVNGAFTIDFTFSEAVTGFDLSDLTVSNGTVTAFSGADAAYTATINPTADGNVTIDVAADVAQDASGNGNTAAATTTVAADLTQPAVSMSTAASLVNGGFTVDITFDESVTGFELSDINIVNATAANFTGSGAAYSVDLTPVTDGAITLDIAAGVATDAAGNLNTVASQLSIEADLTNPTVTLSSSASSPSNADSYAVTVAFSEAVSGLEASDFTVSNGVVSDLTGSGDSYTLTLSPSADGAVTLSLAAATTADDAGNSTEASNELSINSDRTVPSVTASAATLVNGSFTVDFTFSEAVTGFDLSDLTVSNGTVTGLTGADAAYTATINPTADGNVTIDVAADVAQDASGNGNTAAATTTVAADLTQPAVSMSTAASLVNGGFTVDITFDESVTGFELSDINIVNATAANFTGSGAAYSVDLTPVTDGAITLDIAAGVASDAAGNLNTAASQLSIEADLTNPTVTLSSAASSPSNADSYAVTVAFSEAVSGLEASDFTVSNGAVSDLTGSGDSYTLTLSPSADGAVTLSLAAATAADDAGNSTEASNELSINSDRTVPSVTASAATLVNGSFTVDFTFSEAVTGFDLSDLTVSNGTVTGLTGADAAYTATINPTADGNVTIDVAADVAQDASGNGNTAAATTTVAADLTQPAVSMSTAASLVNGGFTVDITFDESVTGFELSDISIVNATAANFTGSGAAYSVDLTPVTDGAITLDIAAGVATDAAGNLNTVASQLSLIADLTVPTVTLSTSASTPNNADSYEVTITFSEAVTGLNTSNFTVSNGAVSGLSGTGASYTMTLIPSTDGEVTLALAAGAATDDAGNGNEASNEINIESDRTKPTVVVSSSAVSPIDGSFTANITFSESVSGLELGDLSVTNGTASDLSGSGAAYTATITPSNDGTVTVGVPAGVVADAATNSNEASNTFSIAADITAPAVTLSTAADNPTNVTSYTVQIDFSESVTGLELSDIQVSNGTASGLAGSGATYMVEVTPAAEGTVTVSLAAGVAADAAGNVNTAASDLSLVYDSVQPTVSISSGASDLVYANSFTANITFSEEVTGFDVTDLTLVNATASDFNGSGFLYTVVISPLVDGEVSVSVGADVATDLAGNSNIASAVVTKTVEATNEAPTSVILSNASILENEAAGTEVGSFSATDPDLGDAHTFLLVSGEGDDNNADFNIIGNALVSTQSFDYETATSLSIRVRATDAQGLTLDAQFSIAISNVDEPAIDIVILDAADPSQEASDLIFDITRAGQTSQRTFDVSNTGTDGNLEVTSMTLPEGFTADATAFTLAAGESRTVTVTFAPTAEATYAGTVVVNSNVESRSFAIAGQGQVNNAPVATVPASTYHYVNGNTIQLTGYDPDGDAIGFEIVTGPALGTLTATGNLGEYTFTPGNLSPETLYTDVITFKVVETEGDLESESADFNFSFEVIDAAHTITDFSAGDVIDDTRTLTLSFDDAVINDQYDVNITYYDLGDPANATLVTLKSETVDKADLTLTATGADYSFEITSEDFSYLFTAANVFVSASLSTSNGFSSNEAFVLTNEVDGSLNNVFIGDEDGLFFVFAEKVTVPENNTAILKLNAVDFGGFDLSNASIEIVNNPTAGTLGLPTVIKSSSNLVQWSITYDADTEVGLNDTFDYSVYSPTRNKSVEAAAEIEVVGVNDAPVLADIADQQINEDQSITIPVSITDPDSEVTVTATSSETTNVPVEVVDGNLVITPAADFNGTTNITVLVTEVGEENPLSTFKQFELDILPVNDQPVVNAINDLTIDEDGQIVVPLSATDADAVLPIFDYSAVSNQPGSVEMSIEAGVLTIKPIANFNGELSFSVYADDRLGTNASVSEAETFTVTVEPVNDAPAVSESFSVQSVVQGFPAYSLDLSAYFTDIETASADLTYTVSSVSNVNLSIEGSLMSISTVAGATGVQTATVTASDGELSASQSITFVTSEASGEVTLSRTLQNLELTEDFDMVSIDLSDVFTYSQDAEANFSFAISGNNNLEASMNGSVLEITTPANFNGSDVIFIVASTNGESAFTSFGITVAPVNDAPTLVSEIADYTATEDAIFFKSVASSAFTDIDGDVLSYEATYDAAWLEFDASTGVFSGIPTNEYVGVIPVTLKATDPSGEQVSSQFNITVLNTNDAPAGLALSNATLSENEAAGYEIGELSTTDVDSGDSFVYALVSGEGDTDNASFSIVDNQLTAAAVLNYELQSSYSIRIQTTDASGASYAEAFTISLTNENEAVTAVSLSNREVLENLAAGSTVGTLSSTDPDANEVFTYTLVDGEGSDDNAFFSLDGATLNTATAFDFEIRSTYQIRVRSTDAGGLYKEEAFTVSIDNVNEVPTSMSLSNAEINENLSETSPIGVFGTEDEDLGDVHQYTLVAGEGSDDNDKFSVIANSLRVAAQLNFEEQSSYQLRVRATDNGGLSIEQQFTITLNDVNESPTAIALSANSIAENEAAGSKIGDLSTTDEDANDSHSYSLVSGEGDTDNAAFSISGSELLTAESFDFETQSSYSVRIETTDAGGLTYQTVLSIEVTDVVEAVAQIRIEGDLSFEETGLGDATELDFTIFNDGNADLNIAEISYPEAFSGNWSTGTITAGSSQTITVTFQPTEEKTYSGVIQITSDLGVNELAVSGEGAIITSIDDPIFTPIEVRAYPNPATNYLKVDLSQLNGKPAVISLWSINGNPKTSIESNGFDSEVTIDVANYMEGVYLLRVESAGRTTTKKVMIKR